MSVEQANYWYPSQQGEQNEILPKLKKNIIHPSPLVIFLEQTPKLLFFTCVALYASFVASLFKNAPLFDEQNIIPLVVTVISCIIGVAFTMYYFVSDKHVYLLDFTVAELGPEYESTAEECLGPIANVLDKECSDFVIRVAKVTGLGQHTHLPKMYHGEKYVPKSMALAREEVETVMKACCDKLFEQTKIDPTKDVDCVITNCSIFNPTPSIGAMLMNKYKMKQTCKNWHLGGMGCSAGVISCDLAKDFLCSHPNSTVLVFSTENITAPTYVGSDKSKLMFFTLFRSGGAAILLTNKKSLIKKCKYEMEETVRIHNAIDDNAYKVIFHDEDETGSDGVSIGRTLINYISDVIDENVKILFPKYLPLFSKIAYSVKKFFAKENEEVTCNLDVRKAFQGFCIHAGGRGVIDAVQKKFNLTDEDCMPSRAGLCRFGNTSSASIWYEFMFLERCELLQKNDRVFQLAFGSGVKANSCVWRKLN
ncbi:hypothetical protein ENUP19_0146G0036 [Entamoeba nuttalli]|uniref:3-ketoacyl-CoA synthase n=2 Tax=Entamoeba nuttalli TaxID=412467 RepID=K2G7L2_ENTNP|nr:fatty acid elongase, putative [Entamoeba nuttalli P19]EKE38421.1 fatty acid elongase, putative [Entamoeba nuttalli P19]|eukprot:XP_008859237.1 fatty acid elongase, putative [Entamoeba nuttalli P19]